MTSSSVPVAVPTRGGESPTVARARMDVVDKGDKFEIKVDLPGVTKEDINVSVEGARVTLQAESRQQKETKDGERVLHSERTVHQLCAQLRAAHRGDGPGRASEFRKRRADAGAAQACRRHEQAARNPLITASAAGVRRFAAGARRLTCINGTGVVILRVAAVPLFWK